ncbi:poly-gamma-glutamate hydrolase family protein [Sphingomonas bacterium]|uniref:poly-gamma-glutamate hydrolase family protein n=1 Tax=Sphingomonas bacterium TaxID=1895847 RepID=UPI001575B0F4|nr:poly-gamma-glutamate hydrolase family protein [Sphingomonas bacterium]
MADRYRKFADLAANQRLGFNYGIRVLDRGTRIAILAPHGGMIEPHTSEIAEAIAQTDLSFYAFEALKDGRHGDFHITSHRFDEPSAIDLLSRSWTAIVIHGRQIDGTETVWLGGRAVALRDAIGASLCDAGFMTDVNEKLPGVNPANVCNRTLSGEGVQLELPRSLRERLVRDASSLLAFCEAVRNAFPAYPDT